jgi:hypothetical protein
VLLTAKEPVSIGNCLGLGKMDPAMGTLNHELRIAPRWWRGPASREGLAQQQQNQADGNNDDKDFEDSTHGE